LRFVTDWMRQWTFVIEHLTKIAHVEPSAACWATREMLGLIRWFPADSLADELAARDVTHRATCANLRRLGALAQ
jgi:hypothetical protein